MPRLHLRSFLIPKKPPVKTRFKDDIELLDEFHRDKPLIKTEAITDSEARRINRDKRAKLIEESEQIQQFISWIFDIQKKLQLTDKQFAEALGIKLRMLYYYKSKKGHLPSKKVYMRARELEKLTRHKITIKQLTSVMVKKKPVISTTIT